MKQSIKPGCKTKSQIAEEYGICRKTFSTFLLEHGIIIRRYVITRKEQDVIYSALGPPLGYDKFRIYSDESQYPSGWPYGV